MKRPLFEVGARVYHPSLKSLGTVVTLINPSDKGDVRAQGYRYLVQHSGWFWSVPEPYLQTPNSRPPKDETSFSVETEKISHNVS